MASLVRTPLGGLTCDRESSNDALHLLYIQLELAVLLIQNSQVINVFCLLDVGSVDTASKGKKIQSRHSFLLALLFCYAFTS